MPGIPAAAAWVALAAIILALSFEGCISQATTCNPASGGVDCPSSTCCGANGYCSGDYCCTSRKCNPPGGSDTYSPPAYRAPVFDYGDHSDHHGGKSVGWWLLAAAAVVGVIFGVVLLCWVLAKCLTSMRKGSGRGCHNHK